MPWHRYLRSYEDGLYVYYKEPKENLKEMTCSEAHGIRIYMQILKIEFILTLYIGYGMLIAVSKRNQQDFDGMLLYTCCSTMMLER